MNINIKKSDGSLEKFDLSKILRWSSWAAKDCPDTSLELIVQNASSGFYEGISTDEITISLCKACEDAQVIAGNFSKDGKVVRQLKDIARNLYNPSLLKKVVNFQKQYLTTNDIYSNTIIINTNTVPLVRYKIKSVLALGVSLSVYDKNLLDGSLSDEFFNYADSLLDYSRLDILYFGGLRQLEEKYLTKYKGFLIEDVQQHFMNIAIALVHSDAKTYKNGLDLDFQKESLKNYYDAFSLAKANNPTPFSVGIRTPHKQYDSCTLYEIGDNNQSIGCGMDVAHEATSAGAGLGASLGRIRARGTLIRNKKKHGGLNGYLRALSATTKMSSQDTRGGSATVNFPLWHRDIYELLFLKDVTSGIEGENRFRHLDYCYHFDNHMFSKFLKREKILLISPHVKIPELGNITVYDAFYRVDPETQQFDNSGFHKFCDQYMKDHPETPVINSSNGETIPLGVPVITCAYELFKTWAKCMMSVGRLYWKNTTHANVFSPFLDPITMTNLCTEILQPTYPVYKEYDSKLNQYIAEDKSEVSFCQLGGVVLDNTPLSDLRQVTKTILRVQEAVFNISEYSKISFSHHQKKRRNVGIGFVNTQAYLVKEVYSKYPQKLWYKKCAEVMHEYAEAFQYYLILASTELAEELGPCEYFNRTKYSCGWLPIDKYAETKYTDFPLKLDWEFLRKRVKKFGMRMSTLSAWMPVESSSVTFGLTSGNEFPVDMVALKGNKALTVAVPVPNVEQFGNSYVFAWGDYSIDINELYLATVAPLNKFGDQGISYNTWWDLDKVGGKFDEDIVLETLLIKPVLNGMRTMYYANFNTDAKIEADVSEEEEQHNKIKEIQETSACASGACSL